MTLLEAVVAFVLLSVVGVVCLDQSRGASQLQAQSAEWTVAVAQAEAALALAERQEPSFDMPGVTLVPLADGRAADGRVADGRESGAIRLERRRWQAGIDVLSVTVPLSGGRSYRLERLAPSMGAPR